MTAAQSTFQSPTELRLTREEEGGLIERTADTDPIGTHPSSSSLVVGEREEGMETLTVETLQEPMGRTTSALAHETHSDQSDTSIIPLPLSPALGGGKKEREEMMPMTKADILVAQGDVHQLAADSVVTGVLQDTIEELKGIK